MKEYFAKLKYLFRWRDLAFTALLFGLIITFALCRAEKMLEVTFGEEAVDIKAPSYSMNIPYDMVASAQLAEVCEDDEVISTREDIALRTGQWRNAVWGEYYACIDVQTDVCVLVRLNDGRIFAFSAKSNDFTQQAYETLLSKIG